ncbi:MAG: hypothetical protein JJ899_02050 [Alphaproteobacteria bacterium]|nr:hypothetical protein [Alphaproteobacteria bacterium]
MGGLAHYLESEGIPTTQISLIRAHTEAIRPPRALAVPFELGRPLGGPNAPDFQRRVLLSCLALLERDAGPVLDDFPDPPPGEAATADGDGTDGWACPVNFAPPVAQMSDADVLHAALSQEVAQLRPWYTESKSNRGGRTGFGISGMSPEDIVRFLADFAAAPDDTPSPLPDTHPVMAFKRMADDLRYFYTEAAIARPDGRGSDVEIANWLWGETTLGALLVAVRDWAMESDDGLTRQLAMNAMVPTHQRHRTKHG